MPIVADATGTFWANGKKIFYVTHGSSIVQFVGMLSGEAESFCLRERSLYVYHIENFDSVVPNPKGKHVITRLDLVTSATTDVLRLDYDTVAGLAFTVESDRLYWAAHEYNGSAWKSSLYMLEAEAVHALARLTDDHGILGVQAIAMIGGKLAVAGGDKNGVRNRNLLLFDVGTGAAALVVRPNRSEKLVLVGSTVYGGGTGHFPEIIPLPPISTSKVAC
jgi:hypothetical protein